MIFILIMFIVIIFLTETFVNKVCIDEYHTVMKFFVGLGLFALLFVFYYYFSALISPACRTISTYSLDILPDGYLIVDNGRTFSFQTKHHGVKNVEKFRKVHIETSHGLDRYYVETKRVGHGISIFIFLTSAYDEITIYVPEDFNKDKIFYKLGK